VSGGPCGEVRRLCALAALFAPEHAPALLSRVSGPPGEAAREATRLVAAARRERLRALGEVLALGAEPGAEPALAERPRVVEVLRAVETGAPAGGAAPALVRLCVEATATCTHP
jgi:hypothetical protein